VQALAVQTQLAGRPVAPLVVELPRLPGSRENRWMHLLSGQPAVEAMAARVPVGAPASQELDELKARLAALEAEVAELREMFLQRSAGAPGQA
jgi:uncharacterized protein YceH (UPF0502 family)